MIQLKMHEVYIIKISFQTDSKDHTYCRKAKIKFWNNRLKRIHIKHATHYLNLKSEYFYIYIAIYINIYNYILSYTDLHSLYIV